MPTRRASILLAMWATVAVGCGRDRPTGSSATEPPVTPPPVTVAPGAAPLVTAPPAAVAPATADRDRPPPSGKAADMDAYPIVDGEYRMTKEWSVTLSEPTRRRFEDDAIVLWRPGFTVWASVWGNDHDASPASQLADIKAESSPDRYDVIEEGRGDLLRFGYRLREDGPDVADGRKPAFYGFVVSPLGHVQLGIYFDDDRDLATALALWRSVRPTM